MHAFSARAWSVLVVTTLSGAALVGQSLSPAQQAADAARTAIAAKPKSHEAQNDLAVALLEEGIRLREAEIEAPILVLSEPDSRDAIEVAKWALTPTVYSLGFVEALADTGVGFGVHVKVDTGMHRVGVAPALLEGLREVRLAARRQ